MTLVRFTVEPWNFVASTAPYQSKNGVVCRGWPITDNVREMFPVLRFAGALLAREPRENVARVFFNKYQSSLVRWMPRRTKFTRVLLSHISAGETNGMC